MKPERLRYRDHDIEVRVPEGPPERERGVRPPEDEAKPVLLIDDLPIPYDRLPDGSYYLHDYAYDWRDDLIDLARGYLDYRADASEIPADRKREGGG